MTERSIDKTAQAPWVLAVDDNQTSRIIIQRQFSQLGLRARTALDGDQALHLWKNGDFALVLTDINMNELTGYELARSIRAIEAAQGRTRTCVLGWTANALPDTRARCLAAGMDDVLHKPADLASLRKLLSHWIPSVAGAGSAAALGGIQNTKQILATHMAESAALDIQLLLESCGNDRSKLCQLLPTIQTTLNAQISAMCVAFDAADLSALKAQSHTLCGSAGLMGAKGLEDVCVRVEALITGGDRSGLAALAAQFLSQARRTQDALARLI